MRWPKLKVVVLCSILAVYIVLGVIFKFMVGSGAIPQMEPTPEPPTGIDSVAALAPKTIDSNLAAAQRFMRDEMVVDAGHVYLYKPVGDSQFEDLGTNSEAVSYYLMWLANEGDKEAFDSALEYVEREMQHPTGHYLMWKLNENDEVVDDGSNIASDADLRAIKALLVAEEKWGDRRYTNLIDEIADGLERVAITRDGYLAPYGGLSGTKPWIADEVWLSYMDFGVVNELAKRRGDPWGELSQKMKAATLEAQIHNGLFNSQLTEARRYGNGLDGGGYSINSLWIMVRSAESNDAQLRAAARESLGFYMEKYEVDGALFGVYSSNGDALSPDESPWVYALVGRAATHLGEKTFAEAMMQELNELQVMERDSEYYGAIPEGSADDLRIGQFTMQESILTMQSYKKAR